MTGRAKRAWGPVASVACAVICVGVGWAVGVGGGTDRPTVRAALEAAVEEPIVELERGGMVLAVQPHGEHAYVSVGRRLALLAPGSEAPVAWIGPFDAPAQVLGAAGDRLVLVVGAPGGRVRLDVLDVADPAAPRQMGSLGLPERARAVVVEPRVEGRQWVWLAMGTRGLWRIDIAQPERPRPDLRWQPPPVMGRPQGVASVMQTERGVAVMLGAVTPRSLAPALLYDVVLLDAAEGGEPVELARRSFSVPPVGWSLSPGHVVVVDRSVLRVFDVSAGDALRSRASVNRRDGMLDAVVVGRRLAVASRVKAGAVELRSYALDDGKALESGVLSGVEANTWGGMTVAAGQASWVHSITGVLRVALAPAPAVSERWTLSPGRYVQIARDEEGLWALTDAGELQRLDGDARILARHRSEEPLVGFVRMGEALVGVVASDRRVWQLEARSDGEAWPRWSPVRTIFAEHFEDRGLLAASSQLLVMRSRRMHAARWVGSRIEAYDGSRIARAGDHVLIGNEVWTTQTGTVVLLQGTRWTEVGSERAGEAVAPMGVTPGGSLAQSGRRFLLGDTVGGVWQLDLLSPFGRTDWRIDMPGPVTRLARYGPFAWAAWRSPTPGLAAFEAGRVQPVPRGEVALSGEPAQLLAVEGWLWVVQADGALTRYRHPAWRTPMPTASPSPGPSPTPTPTASPDTVSRTPTARPSPMSTAVPDEWESHLFLPRLGRETVDRSAGDVIAGGREAAVHGPRDRGSIVGSAWGARR